VKKTVFVVSALLIISCASLFAEQADNGLVITENKNISVIGSNNRNKWLVRVKDRDVSFMLVDMASHKMANFPVDGQPILSAKFVMLPYVSDSMIEVITCGSDGTGFLYLFTTEFRVLMKAPYYDSCYEKVAYPAFHATEMFKNLDDDGQTISRVYRDNHLDVDYRDVKNKTIKISGICDYISEVDGQQFPVLSEQVEKFYKFSDTTKTFELQTKISGVENKNWVGQ
jgi:hypothetical protein